MSESGFRGFMNRGGIWRFLAFLVGYLVIYLGAGKVISTIAPDTAEADVLSSVGAVFVQITFGLVVGAVVLVAAMSYLG